MNESINQKNIIGDNLFSVLSAVDSVFFSFIGGSSQLDQDYYIWCVPNVRVMEWMK